MGYPMMKRPIVTAVFLACTTLAWAQGAKDAVQTFELKDGGRVLVMKNGTMEHYDAAGNRVKMKDGQVMEAKDGTKLMMKNNAIWKAITEHGTLKPGH